MMPLDTFHRLLSTSLSMMPLDTFHHFAQYLTSVSINQGFFPVGFHEFSVCQSVSVRPVSQSVRVDLILA